MSLDFLLEIGTEEIPDWMIPSALTQLGQLLKKTGLFQTDPQLDATPRRLVVRSSGLLERTPDEEQIIKGPPIASGDQAAAGFAKKQGVTLADLERVGNYFQLKKRVPGRATSQLLAESLPGIILGIQWPKTMYWTGKGGPRFIRPIRWIVALLGDQVIPFEIAGVKSGNVSRGHRQLGSASILIKNDTFESDLEANFVILDAKKRRNKIENEAKTLGAKLDAGLLETLTYITEYPTAIRGDFDPAYLELPAEVLTTVMRHHQKYFSVESAPGKLAPHFVAIMNTSGDPDGLVKHGNERVLKARFNDARFFWNVDQQKHLVYRVPDLGNVTFQAKLGSYLEKTHRIVALVEELGGNEHAQRAALLSKTDLTTEMVKEFTDLQGVVGGLYAEAQGEPEPVWRAIYEHYQPLSMEHPIPQTEEGRILALADKLDTLRGCFQVGLIPSGSKDPFALRRAAQGVVKILVEAKLEIKLQALTGGDAPLFEFLLERVQYYFREIVGFKYDEVNAVLSHYPGHSTLGDIEARLSALAAVRSTENFEPLAASFKRIKNILRQAAFEPSVAVDGDLLDPGPERELYSDFRRVQSAAKGAPYRTALETIASLRPRVDAFFDKVLVNAPDARIRANRLTLLYNLLTEFSTIADFSEIVTAGEQK